MGPWHFCLAYNFVFRFLCFLSALVVPGNFSYFLLYLFFRGRTQISTRNIVKQHRKITLVTLPAAPRRPAPSAPPQRSRPSWWHWVLERLSGVESARSEPAEAAHGSSLEELHNARGGEEFQHLLFYLHLEGFYLCSDLPECRAFKEEMCRSLFSL